MIPTPPHDPRSGPDPVRLEANWQAVRRELDAPAASRWQRTARWLGMPGSVAALVGATPALRRAWFGVLAVVVVVGLVGADTTDPTTSPIAFLLLAPLVPAVGVAMAYGPSSDPAHELAVAAPLRGLDLLLWRTLAVLVVSILVLGLTGLLVAGPAWVAAAWLGPALACTGASLALTTRWSARRSVAAVAVTWLVVGLVATAGPRTGLGLFTGIAQLGWLAAAAAATAVAVRRRHRLDWLAP